MEHAPGSKVLFVAAEAAPFAKVGGLADVAGALPKYLHSLGHDVRVILPLYRLVDRTRYGIHDALGGQRFPVLGSEQLASLAETTFEGVPVYFIANDHYYDRDDVYGYEDDVERFLYFCRATLEALDRLQWSPDIIHTNDWHTAAIPYWIGAGYALPEASLSAATVLTIHNLAYQGGFDPEAYPRVWVEPSRVHRRADGWNDLLSQGIHEADMINAVSERYAHEITTPEYGEGIEGLLTARQNHLRGILNGIDDDMFNPATDPAIAKNYSAEDLDGKEDCKLALQQEVGFDVGPRRPLVGLIGRLVDQKGFDLVAEMLEPLLAEIDLQVVILGTGAPEYHDLLRLQAARNRRQIAAYLTFDAALAQRIYAGVDMFLMPSRFEPCGLGQMISLRYGTVPIVRATGGLADTVTDYQGATGRGTGFVFRRYHSVSLVTAISRALEIYRQPERWREIQLQGMRQDNSWTASAQRYLSLYQEAIEARKHRQ
jgi:starch synthase